MDECGIINDRNTFAHLPSFQTHGGLVKCGSLSEIAYPFRVLLWFATGDAVAKSQSTFHPDPALMPSSRGNYGSLWSFFALADPRRVTLL